MHEVAPTATLFGLLVNPTNSSGAQATIKLVRAAADSLGLQLKILNSSTEGDFDAAFATLATLNAGGMVVGNDTFFVTREKQLAALAARYAIPRLRNRVNLPWRMV